MVCCHQITKIVARGTASPLGLLHGALVILIRLQISQFRSLAAMPESQNRQNTTGYPVLSWFPFYFVLGILLAWVSTGSPVLSSTNSDTGTGEMSLLGASSLSRTGISPTVIEEGEEEDKEEE